MCPWRELAAQHLSNNLQGLVLEAESHIDLWWSLLAVLAEAAVLGDVGVDESLRSEVKSIYDYAWWCIACSGDPDLIAEVGTYFYEDLPFYSYYDGQVPSFIDELQFERLERYFRYRLSDEEFSEWRSRYLRARESIKGIRRG